MPSRTRTFTLSIASMAAVLSLALSTPNAAAAPPDPEAPTTSVRTTSPVTDPPPASSQTETPTEETTAPTSSAPTTEQAPTTSETAPSTSAQAPSSSTPTTTTPSTAKPQARAAAVAAGCQTYPPTSYQVCGVIRDKYNQMNGPNSFLLFPKSNELTNPNNTGKRSEFLGGNIYWSTATGAHPVAHDFLTKWGEKGYEGGYLKYPTTDEIPIAGGLNGRRQEYQGGSIYFEQSVGAHTIQGAIKDKWTALGGQQGKLGFPTSDETVTPDGKGRFNTFQNGSIYWSPTTGAFSVVDRVLKAWGDSGYERGTYGYPTAEQTTPDDGVTVKQQFQKGIITAPGPKTVKLSAFDQGVTPEQMLHDAIDAAADAAATVVEVVNGALVEAGSGNSGSNGGRDPEDLVQIPVSNGAGDLFYSDAAQTAGPFSYEHGHNGIYVTTSDTVQALDPDRGVQLVLGTDTDRKVYSPQLMYVHASSQTRSDAVQYARIKVGSGYNNNFALSRRDWQKKEPGDTYNCSQLVWAAYMNATNGALDIDGNHGWGVYPKDILNSPDVTKY